MTENHFTNIERHVPDLKQRSILDLGSGRGGLLLLGKELGYNIVGLEYNPQYIEETLRRAKEKGLQVQVQQGKGEALPYPDASFDFVNMAEVLEHVQEPDLVMQEVYRVVKPNGGVYVSVPSRYGAFDPHFKIYGVNWVPRAWSDAYISLFGKHKEYHTDAGEQRLSHMHYFTLPAIHTLLSKIGFTIIDAREDRLRHLAPKGTQFLAIVLYKLIRSWYFNTFHFILKKDSASENSRSN